MGVQPRASDTRTLTETVPEGAVQPVDERSHTPLLSLVCVAVGLRVKQAMAGLNWSGDLRPESSDDDSDEEQKSSRGPSRPPAPGPRPAGSFSGQSSHPLVPPGNSKEALASEISSGVTTLSIWTTARPGGSGSDLITHTGLHFRRRI